MRQNTCKEIYGRINEANTTKKKGKQTKQMHGRNKHRLKNARNKHK